MTDAIDQPRLPNEPESPEAGKTPEESASLAPDAGVSERADIDRVAAQSELVTVKMLDREYQIKSDQPDLVQFLADEINREGQELRLRNPRLGTGQFDWAVQVAFRMALGRYQSQKSLNKYVSLVEQSTEELSARIEKELVFARGTESSSGLNQEIHED